MGKVLVLTSYFYPEQVSNSYLTDNLFSAIVNGGDDLVVFTPAPSRGIDDTIRKEYKRKKKELFYDGHLVVHRFPLFGEKQSVTHRAIRYILACIKHFNRGVFSRDARECSCIFVASTPPIQGVMAALVSSFRHIPYIYNLQDIFPDSLVGTGLAKKGGIIWKIGRIIENFTYQSADKIIVISEDFKKNIMAKGVPEEKIEVIYNWVDEKTVQPVAKEDNPLYEEFGLDQKKFTVVYAGNLGNAQNISIILDAAYMLPEIQFALFGTGGLENEIRSRIEMEGLMNVHLNPLQPMERVSQVYSLGDVCIVSCKAGLGGSAMPSKTWTIMSCGRPVLANFDEGELKEILEKNDCGLFSHAGDVREFVEAIKVLAANPVRCVEMGNNARRFIEENLTKEVGTKKYVDVIKSFEKK